jgi:hypothetical protein
MQTIEYASLKVGQWRLHWCQAQLGITRHTSKDSTFMIVGNNSLRLLIRTSMDTLKDLFLSTRTTELATYITFISIIVIRISLGYFPTRTKWFGFFGLVGLLQLWLKHKK